MPTFSRKLSISYIPNVQLQITIMIIFATNPDVRGTVKLDISLLIDIDEIIQERIILL